MSYYRQDIESFDDYLNSIPKLPHLTKAECFTLGASRIENENAACSMLYSTDIGQIISLQIIETAISCPLFVSHQKDKNLQGVHAKILSSYGKNRQDYALLKSTSEERESLENKINLRRDESAKIIAGLNIMHDFWVAILKKTKELYCAPETTFYIFESADKCLEKISVAEQHLKEYNNAVSTLVTTNLRLVASLVYKYLNKGLSASELIGEGNEGLLYAARTYNPAYKTAFSTHATWHIKKMIRRALHNKSLTIRSPERVVKTITAISAVEQKFLAESNKVPTIEDLVEELGLSEKQVKTALNAKRKVCQLRVVYDDEFNPTAHNSAGGTAYNVPDSRTPDNSYENNALAEHLLSCLNERQRRMLEMRFGLNCESLEQRECAKKMGISKRRASQIENESLIKIVKKIISKKITGDLLFFYGDYASPKHASWHELTVRKRLKNYERRLTENDILEAIKVFDISKFCSRQDL